jgi:hypothetical protein
LLGSKELIESHAFEEFLVGFKLADDDFLNSLSETHPIYNPKAAFLFGCGSRRSVNFVEKSQLTEPLASFEHFSSLLFNFDLDRAMLNDVKTGAFGALSKDDGSFCHFRPEHVLLDIVNLLFR